MTHWQTIEQQISLSTGEDFHLTQVRSVPGGCINATSVISGTLGNETARFFLKVSQHGRLPMFIAEAESLTAIMQSRTIRVPDPVCYGEDALQSFIVMEYLPLQREANQRLLAQQLAAMHTITNQYFGWHRNNTIGSTHQSNLQTEDWLSFWREQRLGFQLKLAAQKGYGGRLQQLGERLLVEMHQLFDNRSVQASMLHGDLWGGNVAGLADGTPVIFDPAFYYGDYEAELAMTSLFGGFSADFYAAYDAIRPQEDGYNIRKIFYNSYHIINHLNIFGSGYHAQAIHMLEQVLAEIKA